VGWDSGAADARGPDGPAGEKSSIPRELLARAFLAILDGASFQYLANPESRKARDLLYLLIDALLLASGVYQASAAYMSAAREHDSRNAQNPRPSPDAALQAPQAPSGEAITPEPREGEPRGPAANPDGVWQVTGGGIRFVPRVVDDGSSRCERGQVDLVAVHPRTAPPKPARQQRRRPRQPCRCLRAGALTGDRSPDPLRRRPENAQQEYQG
jgi:hypothetical protein